LDYTIPSQASGTPIRRNCNDGSNKLWWCGNFSWENPAFVQELQNKYEGWVLPKGTVEQGEDYKDTALREVLEETGAKATIIKYIGKSEYTFNVPEDIVEKEVHWYLMMADSYYSKPQKEEFFSDSGYYKYHEAYHLLKFANEKQILEKAYEEYLELKKSNLWGSKKYY
jgi:ADP-ribose pyrophosphatase YjhB (NUDIX family)